MTIDEKEVHTYYKSHTAKETMQHFGISQRLLYKIIGPTLLRRPWLEEARFRADLKLFKNNVRLLARYYGVSESVLHYRKRMYGIKRTKTLWTKKEDNYLLMNYFQVPRKEMEKKLGRSWRAIHSRAYTLGIRRRGALGYTQAEVLRDLGAKSVGAYLFWERKLGFPCTHLDSGEKAYSEADIYDWLEKGHILRLDPERVAPVYRVLFKTVQERFITRDELLCYGFNPLDKVHAKTLSPLMIQTHAQVGGIYPRDVVFDYLVPYANRLFRPKRIDTSTYPAHFPKPSYEWYDLVQTTYKERYIRADVVKTIWRTTITVAYKLGFPRLVCVGTYDRKAVYEWCATHRRGPEILRRILEAEGNSTDE